MRSPISPLFHHSLHSAINDRWELCDWMVELLSSNCCAMCLKIAARRRLDPENLQYRVREAFKSAASYTALTVQTGHFFVDVDAI